MDLNKMIARVKAILLTPKTEWPVVASEPTSVGDLFKGYVVWLAAIPAIFGFLKFSLIGIDMPFAGTVRIGVGTGLLNMVLTYVLTLIGVYLVALIVDALAPSFGGQKNSVQALKAVVYAYTAAWVAGVAQIVPGVGLLLVLAGSVYSIYLLYLGLPHTMKNPPEKSAGDTAVTIIAAIILSVVIGMLVGAVTCVGTMVGGATVAQRDADVQFDKDSPLGQIEQWSQDVEKAGKELEAAQQTGDADAQAAAMQQMMGAALGGGAAVTSLSTERIKPFLPETLAGLPRTDLSVARNEAMGLQITEGSAVYSNEEGRSVNLQITDAGSASGLLALASWSGVESEKETATGYEKTYRDGEQMIHEQWDREAGAGEYTVIVGNRFTVQLNGAASDIDELKDAMGEIDLRALAALKDEGVQAKR